MNLSCIESGCRVPDHVFETFFNVKANLFACILAHCSRRFCFSWHFLLRFRLILKLWVTWNISFEVLGSSPSALLITFSLSSSLLYIRNVHVAIRWSFELVTRRISISMIIVICFSYIFILTKCAMTRSGGGIRPRCHKLLKALHNGSVWISGARYSSKHATLVCRVILSLIVCWRRWSFKLERLLTKTNRIWGTVRRIS